MPELGERAFVDQQVEPLARGELVLRVLAGDPLLAAAELGLGAALVQVLDERAQHRGGSLEDPTPARRTRSAMARDDPYTGFNFLVEIDGISVAAFSEVSGLASETEVIEYRAGSDRANTVRKLPGLTKYANIVLKRGVTQDAELWNWRKAIEQGTADRRSGSIVLLDDARNPVRRWHFSKGWVSKFAGPDLNAEANDVAIETIEIAHEGLTLET